MKIVVMSDTHLHVVNDELRDICSRYCRDADLLLHLGDCAGSCVLDYLQQYPLEAVTGNMDDASIRNRLPVKKIVQAADYRIGMTHGHRFAGNMPTQLSSEFPDVDAVLFGHTHKPYMAEKGGVLWFNPGSVFSGRGGFPPSLGILHVEDRIRGEIVYL